MAAWRYCAAVEATAVQGNKPWRRGGCDRCVLWVHTGRVGHVGTAYERAVDVGRRRMSPLCSSLCSSSATSFRCLSLAAAMADAEAARGERLVRLGSSGASDARGTCRTHWCGRAHGARRVRVESAGRRGTPGVRRQRRRSSAYSAGGVTEHGAAGVGAPGRVHGLAHGCDDDSDGSCINSDDGRHTARRSRRGGA
ncbi:hypothetical protein VPH35_025263 [Triticum aestivum]